MPILLRCSSAHIRRCFRQSIHFLERAERRAEADECSTRAQTDDAGRRMIDVKLPQGLRWERLKQDHPRRQFNGGQPEADEYGESPTCFKERRAFDCISSSIAVTRS